MKQEIIKNEKDITVNFGDMFEWIGVNNTGEIFIYLGGNKCYKLPLSPFNSNSQINGWAYYKDGIIKLIKDNGVKKCEKGTKVIIEQD